MHCKHCGFVNGEDDHRCLRCGRRLSGVVIAAPPGYSGANALAQAVAMNSDTEEFAPVKAPAASSTTEQPTLFTAHSQSDKAGPNVIPFDRLLREASIRVAVRLPADRVPAPRPSPANPSPVTHAR